MRCLGISLLVLLDVVRLYSRMDICVVVDLDTEKGCWMSMGNMLSK